MTITGVRKVKESSSGDNSVEYDVVYQVDFTSGYSAAALVANTDARLPKKGDAGTAFVNDGGVYVTKYPHIDLVEDSDPNGVSGKPGVATYQVTFSVPDIERFDISPIDRPPIIRWGGADIRKVSLKDQAGTLMVNSAGDILSDLPEQFVRGGECSITRNEESNPAANVVIYSNSVNVAAWYGVPIAVALMTKIEAQQVVEAYGGANISYWQVTYPIVFNRETWRVKPIDAGYRIKVGATVRNYLDENGAVPPQPILLNGSGAYTTTPVVFPTAGYKIYEETNWTTLDLPDPFA